MEALPLLRVLEARHISETATAQPATVGDTTALPEHALLSGVGKPSANKPGRPNRCQSVLAPKYLLDKLKTKLDRRIADLTGFMGRTSSTDRYMAAFVRESLEMYGLEDKWSDQSIITSRPVVLQSWGRHGCRGEVVNHYSFPQLHAGRHCRGSAAEITEHPIPTM
ncbi:hypothetical protein CWS02_08160 [Enterobacter sp. EA-1]|nr:hypothetical protein CWS02_08160 [Enterobacter sp. EA-1]